MESIVVYGPAYEAFTAMGQLEAAGVSASKMKHLQLAPSGQEGGLSVLLCEACPRAGVTLPSTTQVRLALLLVFCLSVLLLEASSGTESPCLTCPGLPFTAPLFQIHKIHEGPCLHKCAWSHRQLALVSVSCRAPLL